MCFFIQFDCNIPSPPTQPPLTTTLTWRRQQAPATPGICVIRYVTSPPPTGLFSWRRRRRHRPAFCVGPRASARLARSVSANFLKLLVVKLHSYAAAARVIFIFTIYLFFFIFVQDVWWCVANNPNHCPPARPHLAKGHSRAAALRRRPSANPAPRLPGAVAVCRQSSTRVSDWPTTISKTCPNGRRSVRSYTCNMQLCHYTHARIKCNMFTYISLVYIKTIIIYVIYLHAHLRLHGEGEGDVTSWCPNIFPYTVFSMTCPGSREFPRKWHFKIGLRLFFFFYSLKIKFLVNIYDCTRMKYNWPDNHHRPECTRSL